MGRLLIILALLSLSGCYGGFTADNTASGGGKAGFEWGRCPPERLPIGGNTGEVGNTTDDGGTVGTTQP